MSNNPGVGVILCCNSLAILSGCFKGLVSFCVGKSTDFQNLQIPKDLQISQFPEFPEFPEFPDSPILTPARGYQSHPFHFAHILSFISIIRSILLQSDYHLFRHLLSRHLAGDQKQQKCKELSSTINHYQSLSINKEE